MTDSALEEMPAGQPRWAMLREQASQAAIRGELTRAVDRLREAIGLCEQEENEEILSEIWGELGEVYAESGRMEDAIKAFRRALALDQQHGDEIGLARAHRRLGAAFLEKGELKRAQDCFRDAEEVLEVLDDGKAPSSARAELYIAWGSLVEEQGQFSVAREYYGRAERIHRTTGERTGLAVAVRHLASAEHQLGNLDRALDLLSQAREFLDAGGGEDKPEIDRGQQPDGRRAQGSGAHQAGAGAVSRLAARRRAASPRTGEGGDPPADRLGARRAGRPQAVGRELRARDRDLQGPA